MFGYVLMLVYAYHCCRHAHFYAGSGGSGDFLFCKKSIQIKHKESINNKKKRKRKKLREREVEVDKEEAGSILRFYVMLLSDGEMSIKLKQEPPPLPSSPHLIPQLSGIVKYLKEFGNLRKPAKYEKSRKLMIL